MVIELFETRFVELNEYINEEVRMEGDDIVAREDDVVGGGWSGENRFWSPTIFRWTVIKPIF